MEQKRYATPRADGAAGLPRGRLLAVLGISLVIISIVVTLCWLLVAGGTTSSSNACLIQDERKLSSQLSEMSQIKVATQDFRTLARLSGFLNYTTDLEAHKSIELAGFEYLPLKLHNLTHVEGQSGESQLILWTSCARMTLNLASDSKQLIVGSIELATIKAGQHKRECQVSATSIKLQEPTSSRYLCNAPARYECKSSFWHNNDTVLMRTVAILELHSIEFELDGDPKIIRTNQFSKKPAECT